MATSRAPRLRASAAARSAVASSGKTATTRSFDVRLLVELCHSLWLPVDSRVRCLCQTSTRRAVSANVILRCEALSASLVEEKKPMDQLVQLIGAVLILAAFVLAQQRRLATDSMAYLALNAVGAAFLAVVAVLDRDIGFTLLEATWTVVSTPGLIRCVRGPSGHR